MTLTEMRGILAGHGIQLTKSLGQHFLHDRNQLRRIVALTQLQPRDRVLEIGPGLGPLTELLVEASAEVLAIEKDARLVEILRDRFETQRTDRRCDFRLLHEDALDFLQREPRDWTGWRLVANLPYSVASPILVELALGPHPPERMVATLQLEVAQRLMAQAGEASYGVLSLLVQSRYVPRGLFKIPAGCFFPPPDVESACIRLDRRVPDLLPAGRLDDFAKLVKLAFSQRRKMMLKLLKSRWPEDQLRESFTALGLSPQTRAEAVSLEQFATLAQRLGR